MDLTAIKKQMSGRRIFVTGHTGFKGSWLTLWLARMGARVSGYALPPATDPSCFKACRIAERMTREWMADIRDAETLKNAIMETQPDVIFHLAAQSLVRQGYKAPAETFEVNVMGTANVLEAVRACGRPMAVVIVTSDKCYAHNGKDAAFVETDPLGGDDPYSASKAAAEMVAHAYRESFFARAQRARHGVSVATARAGNVIGGGDWADDRLLADAVKAFGRGEAVAIRNPNAVRPWQHVLEPLYGYIVLAARMLNHEDFDGAWNFGPDERDQISVRELMDRVCSLWPGSAWKNASNPDALPEAQRLRLNAGKAMRLLDWQPQWRLDEALERTTRWYGEFYAGTDMTNACEGDFKAYEHSLARGNA